MNRRVINYYDLKPAPVYKITKVYKLIRRYSGDLKNIPFCLKIPFLSVIVSILLIVGIFKL